MKKGNLLSFQDRIYNLGFMFAIDCILQYLESKSSLISKKNLIKYINKIKKENLK